MPSCISSFIVCKKFANFYEGKNQKLPWWFCGIFSYSWLHIFFSLWAVCPKLSKQTFFWFPRNKHYDKELEFVGSGLLACIRGKSEQHHNASFPLQFQVLLQGTNLKTEFSSPLKIISKCQFKTSCGRLFVENICIQTICKHFMTNE